MNSVMPKLSHEIKVELIPEGCRFLLPYRKWTADLALPMALILALTVIMAVINLVCCVLMFGGKEVQHLYLIPVAFLTTLAILYLFLCVWLNLISWTEFLLKPKALEVKEWRARWANVTAIPLSIIQSVTVVPLQFLRKSVSGGNAQPANSSNVDTESDQWFIKIDCEGDLCYNAAVGYSREMLESLAGHFRRGIGVPAEHKDGEMNVLGATTSGFADGAFLDVQTPPCPSRWVVAEDVGGLVLTLPPIGVLYKGNAGLLGLGVFFLLVIALLLYKTDAVAQFDLLACGFVILLLMSSLVSFGLAWQRGRTTVVVAVSPHLLTLNLVAPFMKERHFSWKRDAGQSHLNSQEMPQGAFQELVVPTRRLPLSLEAAFATALLEDAQRQPT